jgi:hypothetical protein
MAAMCRTGRLGEVVAIEATPPQPSRSSQPCGNRLLSTPPSTPACQTSAPTPAEPAAPEDLNTDPVRHVDHAQDAADRTEGQDPCDYEDYTHDD